MQNTDDKNIDNEKATNEEALDATTVVDSESGKELETETQNVDDKDNISINATDEDLSFKASYEKASAAVAISYNEEKKSPFVSALGYESRAQAIIDMAKELGVYDQVKKDGGSWENVSSKTCGSIVSKAIEIANRAVEN